jgi:hypothetical protein
LDRQRPAEEDQFVPLDGNWLPHRVNRDRANGNTFQTRDE